MCLIGVIVTGFTLLKLVKTEEKIKIENSGIKTNLPFCLQMYTSIEKYSDIYKVPKHVAYNVAYRETRYQGPFDWNYHGRLTSYAGAVGPMQIITKWAHKHAGRHITEKELRTNIDLNVMISMKMLRKKYDTYKDWALSCGGYNTGSPIVNDYAIFCSTNKNYKKNWVKY
jgi:soluble lytic murein transglycosylase-like protein